MQDKEFQLVTQRNFWTEGVFNSKLVAKNFSSDGGSWTEVYFHYASTHKRTWKDP